MCCKESNEVTKVEMVDSWFKSHPNISVVTWPANSDDISPISRVWNDIETYVDNQFPLTVTEIKAFICLYWQEMKNDPDYFEDKFSYMKKCLEKLMVNEGGPTFWITAFHLRNYERLALVLRKPRIPLSEISVKNNMKSQIQKNYF